MFPGGPGLAWMSSADSAPAGYEPDVTSYDYQAALEESGRVTPKSLAFRDIIAKATGVTPPPIPSTPDPIAIPQIQLTGSRSLWKSLPAAVESAQPLSMEDISQDYGYVLYRTKMKAAGDRVLTPGHLPR